MKLDADQLLTLLTIVETGSVSEAAARLKRGQPAISERMRRLTEAVGEPLYRRESGRIVPTAFGKLLLPEIQQLRSKLGDIEKLLERRRSLDSGELRVATTSLIAKYFLPPYLKVFQDAHPRVNIYLKSGVSFWENISLSDLDAFFFEGGMEIPSLPKNFEIIPWITDEIVAILHPEHPLASKEKFCLGDLADFPLIWREPSSGVRKVLEAALSRLHVRPVHLVEVDDVDSVGAMTKAGMGIGFVDKSVYLQRPDWGLCHHRVTDGSLVWESFLAIPRETLRSRTLTEFLHIVL
jgi:DNA-binding transcriptional LysR family regulator